MNRTEWSIISTLGIVVALVFCGLGALVILAVKSNARDEQAAAVVLDTPTPPPTWPPTWTPPVQGTATWVIQSAPAATFYAQRSFSTPTRPAPARTRVPGPIPDAWDKTSSAQTQRFEMSMTLAGDIWNLPGAPGPKIEFSFVDLSGELHGLDSHFLMKGYAADLLIPTEKGIEVTTLGDNIYLHGPIPELGAPEAKWYFQKMSALDRTVPLSRPANWLGGYSNGDWSGFKKAPGESFDGSTCDTYLADKTGTLSWYQSANPQDIPDQDLFAAFDAASAKLWVCSDNSVHQFLMTLTTHSKYDPKQKGTLQLLMHFYDINGNVQITAPANPLPLNLPESSGGTS